MNLKYGIPNWLEHTFIISEDDFEEKMSTGLKAWVSLKLIIDSG